MNIKNIKQEFSQSECETIRKFLNWVNATAQKDSDFANDSSLDELNQFSDLSESDADIRTNVKEWLRLKKVRMRGNFTNN
jgi:hypothetical protein